MAGSQDPAPKETVSGYLGSPPSDAHVQGVVAAGFGVGGEAVLLVGLQQRLVLLRQNVSDHHGGPPGESGLGQTFPDCCLTGNLDTGDTVLSSLLINILNSSWKTVSDHNKREQSVFVVHPLPSVWQ